MLTTRLMEFIETHAKSLINETIQDIQINERTRSFGHVPHAELESRISALFLNLGKWMGNSKDDAIQKEYEEWERRAFTKEFP